MAPPPYTLGWVHNLERIPATSDARTVIALAATFSIISVLATLARLYIRIRRGNLVIGDGFILIGTGFSTAYSAVTIAQTRWGLGLKVQDVPSKNVVIFSAVQYAGGPLYCAAILFVKLSLASFVYLLNKRSNRIRLWILQSFGGFVVVSQLIFICLLSFACQPIAKQWDPSIPGYCLDTVPTYYTLGIVSLVGDVALIGLPIWVIAPTTITKAQKVRVIALFSLGSAVTIVQIFRMVSIAKLSTYTESTSSILWSIVEMNLGVLIACLPALNLVLRSSHKGIPERASGKALTVPLRNITTAGESEVFNNQKSNDVDRMYDYRTSNVRRGEQRGMESGAHIGQMGITKTTKVTILHEENHEKCTSC